ncbi:MAG: homoserine dehydrogenase, partial [Aestuariivirgaceae bacterium]|nr:homoserine dehydrogenase [Aestuariivirgaceae bacterium]
MSGKIGIGLAGLGTVGTGVLDLLARNGAEIEARTGKKLEVVAVTARSNSKIRGGHDLSGLIWAESPQALAVHPDVDVFVELIGGDGDPAHSAVKEALAAGKSVVTANKAL